jgi:hypothetical protein
MKNYSISLNKEQYHHPVYNDLSTKTIKKTSFNWRRNLHKICLGIGTLAFSIPLITNPILKEDNEELQRNIKLLTYSAMTIAALVGYANENAVKTLEQRRFDDMKTNRDYILKRHSNKLNAGQEFDLLTMRADLKKLETAQSIGAYGLPYYPEALAGIAMQQFAPAPESQSSDSVNMGNLSANMFHLPSLTESQAKEDVNAAYDYISDKTKRNYRGLLIYGKTGDNKTTMTHYALYRWLLREPDTIPYICDRKYFSDDDKPLWRPNWLGCPVYTDLNAITKPGVPNPSVYAQFYPDLMEWLQPVYKLLEVRTGEKKKTATDEEKLINPITGKQRPVVVIIDDATLIIEGIKKKNKTLADRILFMIDELATLGRSADISIVFVSHANTSSGCGLSSETLRCLSPLVGTSFVSDSTALQWSKDEIRTEGIQMCQQNSTGKVRYFATAWQDNPYIPPAPYTQERGMLDCVIPELTKLWHQTCPDGYLVQEYHTQAIQYLGYSSVIEMRNGEKIVNVSASEVTQVPEVNEKLTTDNESTPHINQEETNELTEKQALTMLRDWANQNEKYDKLSLVKKFAELSGMSVDSLAEYGDNLVSLVSMEKAEFDKL